MNKPEDNTLFILATTILALLSLSYLFDNKKEKVSSVKLKNNGFQDDKESFKKDFSNIAGDLQRAKEKLNDGIK